jgi:hypothetical protein
MQRISTVVNLGSYTKATTISFKQLLSYPHEAEWTPFESTYFSEYLVSLEIELRTFGSVTRNSDRQTTEAVCSEKQRMQMCMYVLGYINNTKQWR